MSESHRSLEANRRECEARYWLKHTGGSKQAVEDLMVRIEKRRGAKAAQLLRDDMRAQWAKQRGAGE